MPYQPPSQFDLSKIVPAGSQYDSNGGLLPLSWRQFTYNDPSWQAAERSGNNLQIGYDDQGNPVFNVKTGQNAGMQYKIDPKTGQVVSEGQQFQWNKPDSLLDKAIMAAVIGGSGAVLGNAMGLLGSAPGATGSAATGGGAAGSGGIAGAGEFGAEGFTGLGGAGGSGLAGGVPGWTAAGSSVLPNVTSAISPSLAKLGGALLGGVLGSSGQSSGGGGDVQFAPHTPMNLTYQQQSFTPNQYNQGELQGLLDYLDRNKTTKRDAYGILGGGGKYTGVKNGG